MNTLIYFDSLKTFVTPTQNTQIIGVLFHKYSVNLATLRQIMITNCRNSIRIFFSKSTDI